MLFNKDFFKSRFRKFTDFTRKSATFLEKHPEIVSSGINFAKSQDLPSGIQFAKNVYSGYIDKGVNKHTRKNSIGDWDELYEQNTYEPLD